jgi:hypothetical protein
MVNGLWWRCWGRLRFGEHGIDVIDGVRGNFGAVALLRLAGIRDLSSGRTRSSCGFILLVWFACVFVGSALGFVLLTALLAGVAGVSCVVFGGWFGQGVDGRGWRCRSLWGL